jgi:uncharacterized phage protein (TIGR02218 family)
MSAPDRLTALALCWRIERRDGVTIALTDHDRDLIVDGVDYHAAPGMTPSAIVRGDGLDADTMEARGALNAAALTTRDLSAGRWDGARVAMFAIDWSDPEAAPIPLGGGTIGEVEMRDGAFTAELRGAAAALERPVTEGTSPTCRALLGDRRCRVPMAGRRRFVRVLSVEGVALTIDAVEPEANAYGDGLLRWFGGANCGLESAVIASAGSEVTLRTIPSFPVAAGTLIELTEGCDKRLATCTERFGNNANFRGEPFLPGIDLLTRYPGA